MHAADGWSETVAGFASCVDVAAQASEALRRGDMQAAHALARRALAQRPDASAAWNVMGSLAIRAGDPTHALTAFGRAAALDDGPRSAVNRAMAFERAERWRDALDAYADVLRRFPGHPKATDRCGIVSRHVTDLVDRLLSQAQEARGLGHPDRAEAILHRALAVRHHEPARTVAILIELHAVRLDRGWGVSACDALRRAVATVPESPGPYAHLAAAALQSGDIDMAERASRYGLVLHPASAEPQMNRGGILLELGRLEEAEAALATACDLTGGRDPRAVYNLAYVRLLRGDLARGFDGYMARWAASSSERTFPVPLWDGRPPAGRLYLWSPTGVGDQILFASILDDVRAAGVDAVVECDPRWRPVWQRSFPWATIIDQPPPGAPFDVEGIAAHHPMAGLGRWFRRSMDAFPAGRRRYLTPDAERAAALRERYRALGDGPLIGLSWRSRGNGLRDRKTIPLAEWAPILTARGVRPPVFVNLQYGDCRDDLRAVEEAFGVRVVHDDSIDQMSDLDGLTAQVAALDLVISVSNTTAHVAGALGVPCWMLAPYGRATLWHWFAERADSPWYPSMRIFRQGVRKDWGAVVGTVSSELGAFLCDPLIQN